MNIPLFHLHETPTDTARRELTEHRAACDACIAGLDCPTGDDLDRRLTEAASADVPQPEPGYRLHYTACGCKGAGRETGTCPDCGSVPL